MSDHAKENAAAWIGTIQEQVAALKAAQDAGDFGAQDAARETITEAPLSVLVRDGWRRPDEERCGAEEFEILLSTGGPALRIRGGLESAMPAGELRLEWQDWGTPWTEYPVGHRLAALREWCSQFYFGEE